MKTKHLLFTLMALWVSAVANADNTKIDGIYYKISGTSATVTESSYGVYSNENSYSGDVTIPPTITYNGVVYPVERIGHNAFYNCTALTSVSIPESVTTIEYRAFLGDKLANLTIPNGVTKIEYQVFSGCEIATLTISKNAINIGYSIFSGSKIDNLIFSDGVGDMKFDLQGGAIGYGNYAPPCYEATIKKVYLGRNITYKQTPNGLSLKTVFHGQSSLNELTIGKNVTDIPTQLFYSIGITSLRIPNNVQTIGSKAFQNCKRLVDLEFSGGDLILGEYAFASCERLRSLYIPASVAIGNKSFRGCIRLEDLTIEDGNDVLGTYAFDSCSYLSKAYVGSRIVGSRAFNECTDLVNLKFGANVETIDTYAFYNCKSLTYVSFPNSVSSIASYAFSNCTGLEKVQIGSGMTDIANYAFSSCNSIKSVYVSATNPPTALDNTFTSTVYSNAILYVPENSIADYQAATCWKKFTNIRALPDSFALNDGESYNLEEEYTVNDLSFTRTFNNTNWQALYLPFSLEYNDWSTNFDMARINDVHQFDDDDDGIMELTELEITRLKAGSHTEPNTPYLIRAKAAGTYTLIPTNKTLYPAEENSFEVTSWNNLFTFTGTYSGLSGSDMVYNGYYAMGGGTLKKATDATYGLAPYRWYMEVSDRYGNPVNLGEVKIMCLNDDMDETGIESIHNSQFIIHNDNAAVYDLSGRKLSNGQIKKGIYIKDGKKFLVR